MSTANTRGPTVHPAWTTSNPSSAELGDAALGRGHVSEQVLYPTAERLLQHCDAVLRLPGASTGADQDVQLARERGLPVYERIEDVPGYAAPVLEQARGRVRRSAHD